MKETGLLLLTALVMVFVMLGGKYLRGDYAPKTSAFPREVSDVGRTAVNRGGRALININEADAETLLRVDGVGEKLAGRIVAYREEHGPFRSLSELTNVHGIGEATLERFRERFTCLP